MDRRQFFRLGMRNIKDTARKQAPALIRDSIERTQLDVTILTDNIPRAKELAEEMMHEHFGERVLRLRESILPGMFPGGILLFQNNEPVNFHDGISLLFASLRHMEKELGHMGPMTDPHLLRYTNHTPAMSRSVSLFHRRTMIASIPLAEDNSYIFTGSLGPFRVAVVDGHFRFERSLCKHQTCTAHPPIIAPGQRITCVPNDITAYIGLAAG